MQRGMMRKDKGIGIIVAVAMIVLLICTVSGALLPNVTVVPRQGNVSDTSFTFTNESVVTEEVKNSTLYYDYTNISGFNTTPGWFVYNEDEWTLTTRTYNHDGNYTIGLRLNGTASTEINTTMYIHVYPEADFYTNSTGFAGIATDKDVGFFNDSLMWRTPVYSWDFDGVSPVSTEEDPIHAWAAVNSYEVNFTIRNVTDNLPNSSKQWFHVFDKPVADFSLTPDNGHGNFTKIDFNLVNESIGLPAVGKTFEWFIYLNETPRGATANFTAENPPVPSNFFGTDGEYNVTLIVNNTTLLGGESDPVTKKIYISPYADFETNITTGLYPHIATGKDIQLTNTSAIGLGPADLTWDCEDCVKEVPDTGEQWNISFLSTGPTTANLTITNSTSTLHNTTEQTFYVYDKPDADFNITPKAGTGIPVSWATTKDGWGNFTETTFNLKDDSTNEGSAPAYEWYIYLNGTPRKSTPDFNEKDPTIDDLNFFDYDGEYNVTLFVNNTTLFGGLSDPWTRKIYLSPYANFTANITAEYGNKVAVGEDVELEDNSEIGYGPEQRLWDCEDCTEKSLSGDEKTRVISFDSAGTKSANLTLTNTTTHLANTTEYDFEVVQKPWYTFTNTTTEGTLPINVTFTAVKSGNTDATSFNWTFGEGNSTTVQNPTQKYYENGTYTVSLTANNTAYAGAVNETLRDIVIVGKERISVDFEWDPGYPNNATGVYPFEVNFTPKVLGEGTIKCNWDFGDGNTALGRAFNENVKNTYNDVTIDNARYYTVTLNATSEFDTAEISHECVLLGIPITPDFNYTCTTHVAPIRVEFLDISTGSNRDEWKWEFPGTSEIQGPLTNSPVVTYSSGGYYDVTMTVNSTVFNTTETKTKTVYIEESSLPHASYTVTPDRGVYPVTVSFDGSGSTGSEITYKWNFGEVKKEGEIDDEKVVTHHYTTPGTYRTELTVTNQFGSNTANKTLKIGNPIIPNFTYDYDMTPVPGAWRINFTDTSVGDRDTWFWRFGDGGTATGEKVQHTYYDPGSYDVNLTASSSYYGTAQSKNRTVVIDTKPIARFSANPTQGETPLVVNFKDLSVSGSNPITTWLWDFGDLQTSNNPNPEHTYITPGSYDVTLTVSNEYGSSKSPVTTIYPYERLVAKFGADPTSGVKPLTVKFTDQSLGDPTRWEWEFGDGSGYTGKSAPDKVYQDKGQYQVNLTVYKDDYLTASVGTESIGTEAISVEEAISDRTSQTITVTDMAPPQVSFKATSPITGTAPLTVSFEDTTGIGFKPVEWLWEFGDGAMSTEQNPTHVYNKTGMYTVALNVKNEAGISRAANPVFVAVTQVAGPTITPAEAESSVSVPSEESEISEEL